MWTPYKHPRPTRATNTAQPPAHATASQAGRAWPSRWLRAPRRLALAVQLDRLTPLWLMAGLLLASWPQTLWMASRMVDGSDDPLGVLALGALLAVLLAHRRQLRQSPSLGWLLAAMALMGAAGWAQSTWPDLLAALFAMLGLACGARALLPQRVASGPLLVLAVLALPLLASLQYFAGYPLRVLVAEVTRWLMSGSHQVLREGSALVVDGHLVLVDAACSGVQLAWLGYFCAASLALLRGLSTRRFAARLPWVGAWVLLGNVARNWVLVSLQAQGKPLTGWPHEAIGLLCLALVCVGVSRIMRADEARPVHGIQRRYFLNQLRIPNRFDLRVCIKSACLLAMPALALAQWGQAWQPPVAQATAHSSAEWPRSWQGQPLRPLALGAVEARFAAHFPGQVARLTNGQDALVWRHVNQPTRMLHPAADCYKALGYRVHSESLQAMPVASSTGMAPSNQVQVLTQVPSQTSHPTGHSTGLWRCFVAEKSDPLNSQRLRVCEQLQDAQGRVFTDTSAWYWAAALGQSPGPWQSMTVAQAW